MNKFNLEYFRPSPAFEYEARTPVCIPKLPFRIHPHPDRFAVVYLSYSDKKWMLVTPQVAEGRALSGVWRSELYEGVFGDGKPFLLPITLSDDPDFSSWGESLHDAVTIARRTWTVLEKDEHMRRHEPIANKAIKSRPEWLDWSLSDAVESAFRGRIVDIDSALLKPKKPRTCFHDEFEEE